MADHNQAHGLQRRDGWKSLALVASVPEVISSLHRSNDAMIAKYGYVLARCPHDAEPCKWDADCAHPCDRDEDGRYMCEREGTADV